MTRQYGITQENTEKDVYRSAVTFSRGLTKDRQRKEVVSI